MLMSQDGIIFGYHSSLSKCARPRYLQTSINGKATQGEIGVCRGKDYFTKEMYPSLFLRKDERIKMDAISARERVNPEKVVAFYCRICKRPFFYGQEQDFKKHLVSRNGRNVCPKMEESDEYEYR